MARKPRPERKYTFTSLGKTKSGFWGGFSMPLDEHLMLSLLTQYKTPKTIKQLYHAIDSRGFKGYTMSVIAKNIDRLIAKGLVKAV